MPAPQVLRKAFVLFPGLLLAALALLPSSAGAAAVTLGPPVGSSAFPAPGECGEPCTVVHTQLPSPGLVASPIDGVLTTWSVQGASPVPGYAIRVVTKAGPFFTGSGRSAPVTPVSAGVQTFSTQLPVKAGQYLGIDIPAGGQIAYAPTGGEYAFFEPPLPEGEPREGEPNLGVVAFSAVVQPAPTVASLSPTRGPAAGGTAVTITGSDFENATAVSFGPVAATTFGVNSESQITAVAPAGAAGSSVPLTVTTPAGSTTSAQTFAYNPECIVPKVKGLKLKAAKRKIRKAHCKPGTLVIPVGPKGRAATRKLKVKRTKPKAGAVRPAGTKVKIILARP